ncbi:uncharacterized protein BCR38DRAFT_451997 [Pseudomassariella vexata]|uniref:Peptidase M20 domain-containing protein 2 n=1 Tax=Pseudomassariella vexata TaxID=1141098 RepID=A0A1Y2D919_9PEZI|nr:uncharacterized protein BCR38DRAFT_451997 [Pseudomassariella vexata]ORY55626.1 hypothetical protein BCR38DRAFT_451997 [Pseudomassariella vexata]
MGTQHRAPTSEPPSNASPGTQAMSAMAGPSSASVQEESGSSTRTFDIDFEQLRKVVISEIDNERPRLKYINEMIHQHPETAYDEVFAHDLITREMELVGFAVKQKTYDLRTSFEVESGTKGRLVIFCAEYDALPEIGHGCGHNLIATASIAAFLGAAGALERSGADGRVRLLGTPAEEGGGGKVKLLEKGAFDGKVAAAIMAHPMGKKQMLGHDSHVQSGLAALKLIASHKFKTEFHGKSAHAAGEPWNGTNALDAAVAAYNNVALLRQQIQPDERVHMVFEAGGTVPNIIPNYTRMNWNVRSPTVGRADKLLERVKACISAGAMAAGCEVGYIPAPTYQNLIANETLCSTYKQEMALLGEDVVLRIEAASMNASTDMGNVAHVVPSFHGAFAIPTEPDVAIHSPQFAEAAATDRAHEAAMTCAQGMAMLALRVLLDDGVADATKQDFENKKEW